MGHGHGHGHGTAAATARSASGRYRTGLLVALLVGAAFMVVELVVGLLTSSLALLSDAAHMFTDVVGVGMALAAVTVAMHAKPKSCRTFGLYRAEVLAALANAVLLFAVAGYVLYEAISRFADPPRVPGLPVILAAAAGLLANLVSLAMLRGGAEASLNVRGAYLEVLADLIGSIGVLASGAITLTTGWRYADPIIGLVIGLFVLPRTASLAKRALRILFQHAPAGVDVDELGAELVELPGVTEIHDLHVWTLTSGMEVVSAHLAIAARVDQAGVLRAAQQLLADHYEINHATLQVESRDSTARCRELSW